MSVAINKDFVRKGATPAVPSRSHLVHITPDTAQTDINPTDTTIFTIPTRNQAGQYINPKNCYFRFECQVDNKTDQKCHVDRNGHSLIQDVYVESSGNPVETSRGWCRLHSSLQDLLQDEDHTDNTQAYLMGATPNTRKGVEFDSSATSTRVFILPVPSQFFQQNAGYIPVHKIDNLTLRIVWQPANQAIVGAQSDATTVPEAQYKILKPTLHLDYVEVGQSTMNMIESSSAGKMKGAMWEMHRSILQQSQGSHVQRVASAKSSMKTLLCAFYDSTLRGKVNNKTGTQIVNADSYTSRSCANVDEIQFSFNGEPLPNLPLRDLQGNSGGNLVQVAVETQRAFHTTLSGNAQAYKKGSWDKNPIAVTLDNTCTFAFGCSPEAHNTHSGAMSGVSTLQNNPEISLKFGSGGTPAQLDMETYCHYDCTWSFEDGRIVLSQ